MIRDILERHASAAIAAACVAFIALGFIEWLLSSPGDSWSLFQWPL